METPRRERCQIRLDTSAAGQEREVRRAYTRNESVSLLADVSNEKLGHPLVAPMPRIPRCVREELLVGQTVEFHNDSGQRLVVDVGERFPRLTAAHQVDDDWLRPLLVEPAEVWIARREITRLGNRDHTLQEVESTEVRYNVV